jgi:hypothetical protein
MIGFSNWRVGAAAILAANLGCGNPSAPGETPVPPRDNSLLQTEQLEYPFTYSGGVYTGSVVATYTNSGASTVYLSLCGNDAWPDFFIVVAGRGLAPDDVEGPLSICTGTPPVRLEPGETRTDTLHFFMHEREPDGDYTKTPRNAGRSGLYRILYHPYARVSGDGDFAMPRDPLPDSVGQSNVFRIRFEAGP